MITTIKSLCIAEFEDDKVLLLKSENKFQGIKKNDDGKYEVVDDCDTIAIDLSAATAMLCNCNEDIAMYRSCQSSSFTQKQLALIMIGAKAEIDRTFVKEGDVIPPAFDDSEERIAEHDMFSNIITKVTLSAKAQSRLDDALAL